MMEQQEMGQGTDNWARPVDRLNVQGTPDGAVNLNVQGRHLTGPLKGFGQLWQKTYRLRMPDASIPPEQVVKTWKERLPEFMPADSRFYPSFGGVAPGEVVLINATVPAFPGANLPVSTGVMILYADALSFTVMTPEGHPESGFNTFSAYEEDGHTVLQIQSLGRATDPVYEFGYRVMGGAKQQEKIWHHVLASLARSFGVEGTVEMKKVVVDPRLQWAEARNIWHNALIRTVLYTPFRLLRGNGRAKAGPA